MRCSDFNLRWNEVLDLRELPQDDPQLRDHLESCAVCRGRHASFELACEILAGWDWAEPFRPANSWAEGPRADRLLADGQLGEGGDALTERVLAELAAPRYDFGPGVFAGLRPGLALRGLTVPAVAARVSAMGVAAAVLVAMYFSSSPQRGEQRLQSTLALQSKTELKESVDENPVADTSATHGKRFQHGRFPYGPVEDARPREGQFADRPALAIHLLETSAFGSDAMIAHISAVAEGFDDVVVGTGQELATVVQRTADVAAIELASDGQADLAAASVPLLNVSHSLRPVATSMTEAWQILMRALPTGEPRRG